MRIDETVREVFGRLSAGQLTDSDIPVQDGWETSLPSGKTVARSALDAEAAPLVALGPEAVPSLLPWVSNDNAALRYVAIHALEQITGQRPHVPYFDQADVGDRRAAAIDTWRKWYATHRTSRGSAGA
jgi:hypothetical protein